MQNNVPILYMKPTKKSIVLIAIVSILFTCKPSNNTTIYQSIEIQTNEIFDTLVKVRRDLHQNPELSGKEQRTSKIIAEYLLNLGLEVKTNIAGYGVIGILKGSEEGKNIAWRADMDAIASNFPEDVSFHSKNKGIQHGCGHDIHMAIGLGIAEVLSKHKASIKGTIYFIFQPEEETFVGASNMVNSTFFSDISIDEIYAAHVTAFPTGKISVKANEQFAYQKRIQIQFSNEFSEDNAKALYSKIRTKTQERINESFPWEISKAFDTIIGLTNPNTMFNNYLFLEENYELEKVNNQLNIKSYAYCTNKKASQQILTQIEKTINTSEYKEQFISIDYIQENPTVLNDQYLVENAINTLTTIYGNHSITINYGQIPYFNDDFIYFQKKIPGVYFLLGGSNPKKGINAMNHAPNFKVDEECIKVGVRSFSTLLLERVNQE